MIPFYEVPRGVKFREIESRRVLTRAMWEEEMEVVWLDTEFQFCKMKSSQDWLQNSGNAPNITKLYT